MTERKAKAKPPEAPAEPFCEPWEAGLDSEAPAVARRLAAILNALVEVNDNTIRGTLSHELWRFRVSLHERLVAAGWCITAKQGSGWKVLAPKARKAGR